MKMNNKTKTVYLEFVLVYRIYYITPVRYFVIGCLYPLCLTMVDADQGDELEFDFEASLSSFSDTNSHYTLDSGVSFETHVESDNSLSPFGTEYSDESWSSSPETVPFLEIHSILVSQAAKFLGGSDAECALNSAIYLFHVCKSGYTTLLIQRCPDLISNVFPTVCSQPQIIDLFHFMSGIIHYLSQSDDGIDFMLNTQGTHLMTHFLANPLESVVYYTVTAIHNLLLGRKSSREAIRQSLIPHQLVNLLNLVVNSNIKEHSCSSLNDGSISKFLAVLCDCLQMLSFGHEATKKIFLDEFGVLSIINVVTTSYYEKLLWMSTRLLRVLSAWLPTKTEILRLDSNLRFVTHCLRRDSTRVSVNALWTLRNLSDIANDSLKSSVMSSMVELLIMYLRQSLLPESGSRILNIELKEDPVIWRCILGILANLTCGNSVIKRQCVEVSKQLL